MIFLLDRISLDDTRIMEKKKRPIKLIERYAMKNSLPKPMISVSFESKIQQENEEINNENELNFIAEKRISTTLSNLRLCVNVDYLLLLHDFFVDGLPKKYVTESMIDDSLSEEASPRKSARQKIKKIVKEEIRDVNQRLFCEVKIENPQFILYENQFQLKKTNSLIIDGTIFFNLNSANNKTKIYAALSDFMIKLRSARTKKFQKQNKYLILSPTTLSFTGVIDENEPTSTRLETSSTDLSGDKIKTSFTLDLQEINFNLCPLMLNTSLKMATSIQNSVSQRFKSEVIEVKEENKVSSVSLFQTMSFDSGDFWFTQNKFNSTNFDSMSMSSSSSDLSMSQSRRMSEFVNPDKSQLIIRTSKVYIKLEAGVSEQIPLIGLNLSIHGEFTNWSFKPCLSIALNLEMAYFNESLSVWEPVIERIELPNENFKPYELLIDMMTQNDFESDYKSRSVQKKKPKSEINIHTTNLKPIRTFHVHSSSSLQFVVTKNFLNLIETVGKSFQIKDEKSVDKQDELDLFELEEECLIEKLNKTIGNKVDESDSDFEEIEREWDDGAEEDEENTSFNFLIKNELGYDVSLESISGFKVLNIFYYHLFVSNLFEKKSQFKSQKPLFIVSRKNRIEF
jgi:hypothetical protein